MMLIANTRTPSVEPLIRSSMAPITKPVPTFTRWGKARIQYNKMSNTQFGRKTIRLSGQGMICSNSAMRKESQITQRPWLR
ncbi:Uncharacterised protein [Klebsiella pneumoniae]|nr:Uncharacterised protein [Klebsiella pneumoniae]